MTDLRFLQSRFCGILLCVEHTNKQLNQPKNKPARLREDARLPVQALRYAIAAFGGFAADYCALLLLKEWAGLHYLAAVPIAFVIGLAANYLIGIWLVFRRGKLSLGRELLIFVVVSLLALALTEGTMYALTDLLNIDYRISRIASGAVTYLFNFFSRRLVLYRNAKPKNESQAAQN